MMATLRSILLLAAGLCAGTADACLLYTSRAHET